MIQMIDIRWNDVRDTLRIEEVEDALGLDIKVSGDEHWCSCPLSSHPGEDANPSFSLNVAKQFIWNCFGCQSSGNLPELVMDIMGIASHPEAVKWLSQYSDAELEDDVERFVRRLEMWMEVKTPPEMERGGDLPWVPSERLLDWADNYEEIEQWVSAKWQINNETARAWGLGFDPIHERAGHVGPVLTIPHFFRHELVGYQARWIDPPAKIPKYVNTVGFPKNNTLFGWDKIANNKVVVVESVMTCIRLWQEGINAVATFGASYPEGQLRLLSSLEQGIIIAYDNDLAGQSGMFRLVKSLERAIPIEICPAQTKEKGDLADLTTEEIYDQLSHTMTIFEL